MRLSLLLLGSLASQFCSAQVLIKNVNVVDVEKKKILQGYNVVALEGKIISVDKDKMYKLPEGTTVIDGTGKWLVPGFTDAHVHFFQDGGINARPDVIDLRKYRPYDQQLKSTHALMDDLIRRYSHVGITSVIDVGASYNFLRQKDTFTSKNYSPIIRMTGPLLTTYVPAAYKTLGDESPFAMMETEEGVRKSVRDQIPLHANFIKIWYIVQDKDKEAGARKNLPLVKAVIDEAHKNNLRVAVHASQRITAQLAVEAGADYLVHSVDDEVVSDAFVQLLKKNKTVLCPTLVVYDGYMQALGDRFQFSTDALNTANPASVATIIDYPLPDTITARLTIQGVNGPQALSRIKTMDSIMMANLQKLVAGGVIIATGTDAGNIGTQHISSYFDELKAMQSGGMNNWQLLESSTINGAKAVGEDKLWGSIAKDKMANMVLLNADPTADIANWRKIDYVINQGVPFKPDSLLNNTPEMLAQQQLNAYNAHDLDAFLAPYSDDVEIYELGGKLLMKGKEQMRKDYTFITRTPKLYCHLLNRIVQGNTVIDHEEVYGFGDKPFYGVAIYKIEKGKIVKVYFTR